MTFSGPPRSLKFTLNTHSLCSSSGCCIRPQLPCPHIPPLLKQHMVLACSYLAQELRRPWTVWTIIWQDSVWQIKVVRMRAQQGACSPSPSFPSDSNASTQTTAHFHLLRELLSSPATLSLHAVVLACGLHALGGRCCWILIPPISLTD